MIAMDLQLIGRRSVRLFLVAFLAVFGVQAVYAEEEISQSAVEQINALLQEKETRTVDQQKLGSQLWYAIQQSRGLAIAGLPEVYGGATDAVRSNVQGAAKVTIKANVSDAVLNQIVALGGTVRSVSADNTSIVATVPLSSLEALAANADVSRISPAPQAKTSVGALTSQGYISHKANLVVNNLHFNGAGVKVGVLSDSANASVVAALKASGDLPADTVIVPGQSGDPGTSEGTAMMEIVYDMAPGAKLFFATAYDTPENFANNIRILRNVYGCDVIVDDVSYSDEGVFQDSTIALAVNDVVASGAIYFSSAGNGGNVTNANSSVWEGDFSPGPASAAPLPAGYTLHLFNASQAFNRMSGAEGAVDLQWSDPLGGSSNDYDLFILNAAGTTVSCASTNVQNGTQDPWEECYNPANFATNSRIVVAKRPAAATRALHVANFFGTPMAIATSGVTSGHNAGRNTVSMAASYWNSAKTGTKAFVGGTANPTETFSSDGPRKIFYNANGTAITPGNFLFATNGGQTLQKPDLTAADGASSKTPGFLPFFGTSAAAPHAAGIAALVKSARPGYTNSQIATAMTRTALDIRAPGNDRDSGFGMAMALEAVNYALSH